MADDKYVPVIVSGVRTPFMRSHKAYVDLSSCDLGRIAIAGLLQRSGLSGREIDYVCMGTVINNPDTPNVARESMLAASLPVTIPAHTVSLACISANVAATTIADKIRTGQIEVGIAGGTDTCSDPPIRVSRKWRKMLVRLGNARSTTAMIKELAALKTFSKFSDFLIDTPRVAEYSNGKTMGQGCEILVQQVGVTREEADLFAERSHRLAIKAQNEGIYNDDIVAVHVPPKFTPVEVEDGPRADTTMEGLHRLRPAFDKQIGISTAGNSSFLTDGAAAICMMSLAKCQELQMKPMAIVKDYYYAAGDALKEMLTGPALSIPVLLSRNNLKADDICAWEIHEAFAAQVVANLKYIADPKFNRDRLGIDNSIGEIPWDRVNLFGGSLSIGHPFGATGARLLWTAARRLQEEKGRFAVVSGCAAGGHGSAILLENPNL